eukprot:1793613-Pleurochrysis_carterae.AAC.4
MVMMKRIGSPTRCGYARDGSDRSSRGRCGRRACCAAQRLARRSNRRGQVALHEQVMKTWETCEHVRQVPINITRNLMQDQLRPLPTIIGIEKNEKRQRIIELAMWKTSGNIARH